MTDRIFLSFWTIFCTFTPLKPKKLKFWKYEKTTWRYYDFTHVHHKWQSYDVWFLRYGAWQTELFITLGHFLPFYHPNSLKNQYFEKMKKSSRDIIILHKCTINDNYMMYGSWDMKCDRYNFLSFWTFLCPFTPLTTWKTGKKSLEISSVLYKWTKNYDHMLYCSLDMASNGCNCYFSFWAIFCTFTSLTAWKIKI